MIVSLYFFLTSELGTGRLVTSGGRTMPAALFLLNLLRIFIFTDKCCYG